MKKRKPNIIDVIIILVILFVAAAAIFRTLSVKQLPDTVKDQEIAYTLRIHDIDIAYANALKPGDTLYLASKALACGEIAQVSSNFVSREVYHTDGTVSRHLDPGFVNLEVEVKLSADLSESGFYIGENTYLSLGNQLDFYTPTFSFHAQITAISRQ